MQIVPIQAIPNQQLDIVLDSVSYRIKLRTIKGVMVADIERAGVTLINGTRCLANELIIPYRYLESGNFIFVTKDYELPNYEQFGITQNLVFITASELETLRSDAGLFNLDAPLPLRYSRPPYYYIDGSEITNYIRNNTMVGALPGTPGTLPTNWSSFIGGGLAQQIIGIGQETNLQYIDWRVFGTASSASGSAIYFETNTGVPALNGQQWNTSAYLRLVGGSLANIGIMRFFLDERTADGSTSVYDNYGVALAPTAFSLSTQRFNVGFTLAGGVTVGRIVPSLELTYASGAVVDVTVRIGLPQLETGLIMHNPVRTP